MTLSVSLWRANQDLAQTCLENPFIRGLADGSLPRASFAYYIGQDACFLDAFARAYSIAAAKAPCHETFSAFHCLADGVLSELKLHTNYARTWEIDLATVKPSPATRQYVDFLLSTAWQYPVSITAVSMAPCMRLYAFLGQSLASKKNISTQYDKWITTYSSPEFENLAQTLEALVDQLAQSSDLVQSSYRYAMVCEVNFFSSACQS